MLSKITTSTFQKLNRAITFWTKNTINKIMYSKNRRAFTFITGVYKVVCDSGDKLYIVQTGRPLQVRFNEHLPKKRTYEIVTWILKSENEYNKNNQARHKLLLLQLGCYYSVYYYCNYYLETTFKIKQYIVNTHHLTSF